MASVPSDLMVRIVIADDHPIFRDGLRRLLASEPGFEVVGEAGDGAAALGLVRDLDPDILLLDLAMPTLGGLDTLQALAAARVRVIVLTAAIGESDMLRALQLGVSGVVMKDVASRKLCDDIRSVMRGDCVVSRDVLSDLVRTIQRPGSDEGDQPFDLTARELEIISAIVAGQGNKEIARHLGISVQTVKHHLTNIFNKTGVR